MNSIEAMLMDQDEYIDLCRQYNEEVKRDKKGFIDCYGAHCKKLKDRRAEEWKIRSEVEREVANRLSRKKTKS